MSATAMPSALPDTAASKASTISATTLFSEPVHWYVHPRSAQASAAPYWVGVKKALVVTWFTNTNFHLGWLGKLPSFEPLPGELVVPHAANAVAPRDVLAVTASADLNRLRRFRGMRDM